MDPMAEASTCDYLVPISATHYQAISALTTCTRGNARSSSPSTRPIAGTDLYPLPDSQTLYHSLILSFRLPTAAKPVSTRLPRGHQGFQRLRQPTSARSSHGAVPVVKYRGMSANAALDTVF